MRVKEKGGSGSPRLGVGLLCSAAMPHVLHSTRVLVDGELLDRFVVINDAGRIQSITAEPPEVPGEDLGDLVLMPGLVDTHVHINEPGRTEWEGFETASQAAAVGGITTIVDMPLNCIPVTTTAEALAIKLQEARPRIHVDAAFWGGVIPGNADDLTALAAGGVVGAKCFLCHSGIDDFPASDADVLRKAMPRLRDAGIPLLVHAELELPVEDSEGSDTSYNTFLCSRPPEWEVEAIRLIIDLVRETGCPAHIVHLSAADALPLLKQAREEGLPISVETCPHYLCLTAEEVPDGRTEFKCCPPIREDDNRARLWQGLRDGIIDIVVSDHSPCTPHLKVPERGDFMEAWGGISSLQLGLSTIWTEASARGFSISELARWMSSRPAALIGQSGRKGSIRVGADADLVAWDPDESFIVEASDLHHRHKVSPYVGRTVRGRVHHTWLRGTKIASRGTILTGPTGRPLLERS